MSWRPSAGCIVVALTIVVAAAVASDSVTPAVEESVGSAPFITAARIGILRVLRLTMPERGLAVL